MKDYPHLSIQILCVGSQSGKIASEGADREHLKRAIEPGMLMLYKLAFWYRNQFQIRIVCNKLVDVSLRCTILMDENVIEKCSSCSWRVGLERGLYGENKEIDPYSSSAIQINALFDRAFRKAIPAKKNFAWFCYI